jgi:hypothetical protein
MELTIFERLMILNVLPAEGNIVTLRLIGDLKRNLSFTEEEIKTCNIKWNGNLVTWDDRTYKKEINIGEKAFDVVAQGFKDLNTQKKLTEQQIPLYERFVEEKKDASSI